MVKLHFSIAVLIGVLSAGCASSIEPELSAETKEAIDSFKDFMSNVPTSVAFSADGQAVFAGTGLWNAKVRSWDVASGKPLKEVRIEANDPSLRDRGSLVLSIVEFEPSRVAIGGRFTNRSGFLTWDRTSDRVGETDSIPVPQSLGLGSRPGEFICGMGDGTVARVDIVGGRLTEIGKMRSGVVRVFTFPNGTAFFTLSEKFELTAWSAVSGEQIANSQFGNDKIAVDVTQDGSKIAVATEGVLSIYSFDGEQFSLESQRQINESLLGIAWSHDASLLAGGVPIYSPSPATRGELDEEEASPSTPEKGILRVFEATTWSEVPTDLADEAIGGVAFSPASLVLAVIDQAGRRVSIVDFSTNTVRRLDRF